MLHKCSKLNYSLFALMDKLYEAKRSYYSDGSSKLSDAEYDAIENSFKAVHGVELYDHYICVGYDKEKHKEILELKNKYDKLSRENWNIKTLYLLITNKELLWEYWNWKIVHQ